jgi:hypothetical protein
LNIEFSSNNDFMAVSFDNQKIDREEDEAGKAKEGSFVKIYTFKEAQVRSNTQGASNSNSIYQPYDEIRNATQNQTFENKHK